MMHKSTLKKIDASELMMTYFTKITNKILQGHDLTAKELNVFQRRILARHNRSLVYGQCLGNIYKSLIITIFLLSRATLRQFNVARSEKAISHHDFIDAINQLKIIHTSPELAFMFKGKDGDIKDLVPMCNHYGFGLFTSTADDHANQYDIKLQYNPSMKTITFTQNLCETVQINAQLLNCICAQRNLFSKDYMDLCMDIRSVRENKPCKPTSFELLASQSIRKSQPTEPMPGASLKSPRS